MTQWLQPVRQRLEQEYGPSGGWICILATADAQGRPSARSMVLREISSEGTLLFVSDRRTRKDAHIRVRPEVEVVFWLPQANCQIRVGGQATVVGAEMDDFMRSSWWEKLDTAGAQTVSGDDATGEHPVPGTFELIVVNPDRVEIDDYSNAGCEQQSWQRSGHAWQSVSAG
jgi:hypothetical protein